MYFYELTHIFDGVRTGHKEANKLYFLEQSQESKISYYAA